MLLEKGADVNAQSEAYGNALNAACFLGHNQVVQMLLDKGADINAQCRNGSALQMASKRGYQDIVKLLRQRGAKDM